MKRQNGLAIIDWATCIWAHETLGLGSGPKGQAFEIHEQYGNYPLHLLFIFFVLKNVSHAYILQVHIHRFSSWSSSVVCSVIQQILSAYYVPSSFPGGTQAIGWDRQEMDEYSRRGRLWLRWSQGDLGALGASGEGCSPVPPRDKAWAEPWWD